MSIQSSRKMTFRLLWHRITTRRPTVKPIKKGAFYQVQYPRNTARRPLDYQNRVGRPAVSAIPVANDMTDNSITQNSGSMNEGVGRSAGSLSQMPLSLAMAYVPFQEFRDLNEPEQALMAGSLFRELDKPFYGQRRRTT